MNKDESNAPENLGISPEIYGEPTTLDLLRDAVKARVASWDAVRSLELHLGFDDTPDKVDDAISDCLDNFAGACLEVDSADIVVTEAALQHLLTAIEAAKTPSDCEQGIHSWSDAIGRLPADTKCTDCGEPYGDPT